MKAIFIDSTNIFSIYASLGVESSSLSQALSIYHFQAKEWLYSLLLHLGIFFFDGFDICQRFITTVEKKTHLKHQIILFVHRQPFLFILFYHLHIIVNRYSKHLERAFAFQLLASRRFCNIVRATFLNLLTC